METEVIDDLVTDDPYAALSARQGMILRQMIENVASDSDIDAIFN
jgi:hypothetical protein